MASRLGFSVSRYRFLLTARRPLSRPSLVPSAGFSSAANGSATTSGPTKGPLSRFLRFSGRAALFTFVGFIMTAAPAYETVAAMLFPPSDADSLTLFTPTDEDAQSKEDFINAHPIVVAARADPNLVESRPHMKIPPSWRKHNLTGGTLIGPGKVAIPPFSWSAKDGSRFLQISHVGTDLCGHMGIIHGGFLATMLDEGLARCCFPVLPFNIGMTAKLEINYLAPAIADQYLVLRATTTKVEGRKAWVEGWIETLPTEEGQRPVVLAKANALYISPRQASTMAKIYPVAT